MRETNQQEHQSSVQKTARKSTKHWRNETICKMVSLGQKLKMPKTCEKPFYKNIRVVLCKKALEKTGNIREMRRF